VATACQLATLIYPSRRTAFRHLRRLWQLGLLERAPLPPLRGGVPIAYRLSRRGMLRLGYRDQRLGGVAHLRHSLDIVASVCALVGSRNNPDDPEPVQVWLPDSIAAEALADVVRPDSVVALQTADGSGVVCLEVDEATEHAPTIRAKLAAYDRALRARPGWHLLFVAPTEERLAWLRRVAGPDERSGLAGQSWGALLTGLEGSGLAAGASPVGWRGHVRPLRGVLTDPRHRRCPTPVGSDAWVRLLGSGGGEDLAEALR
jgi:hypothetical protein